MNNNEIKCLDYSANNCHGAVEYRFALSGTGRSFPRCDKHWADRLGVQDRLRRDYGIDSDVPPAGFDPTFAGESWDEDY